jgi:hypothetical protein
MKKPFPHSPLVPFVCFPSNWPNRLTKAFLRAFKLPFHWHHSRPGLPSFILLRGNSARCMGSERLFMVASIALLYHEETTDSFVLRVATGSNESGHRRLSSAPSKLSYTINDIICAHLVYDMSILYMIIYAHTNYSMSIYDMSTIEVQKFSFGSRIRVQTRQTRTRTE